MVVLESSSAISTVASNIATSFGTQATDMASAVGTIITPLLPLVGAIAVVGLGLKLFKRVTR